MSRKIFKVLVICLLFSIIPMLNIGYVLAKCDHTYEFKSLENNELDKVITFDYSCKNCGDIKEVRVVYTKIIDETTREENSIMAANSFDYSSLTTGFYTLTFYDNDTLLFISSLKIKDGSAEKDTDNVSNDQIGKESKGSSLDFSFSIGKMDIDIVDIVVLGVLILALVLLVINNISKKGENDG